MASMATPSKAAPAAAPAQALVSTAASHTSREIFGFALASSLSDPTVGYPSWNFDLLSTVAFFGLHVDTAGHFIGDNGWTVWNSSALTNLVSIAHQHGVKVVLTIVLQDFAANTPSMCAGLAHADATVAQTVSEVKAKGVDGVNIDYEGLDGSCGNADPYWAQHAMTSFTAKMRAGLGSTPYFSIDTYASSAGDGYGFFDVAGLAAYVDSMFVMAYDMEYSNYYAAPINCSRFCLGPTSPLNSYKYNNTNVMAQYVAVVPASKVILGVPYFGRKACVAGTGPNQYPTSSVVADSYLDASTEVSYFEVQPGSYVAHREANSSGMERWDTWFNTTLNCTRELYWDDTVSLGKKYDLVNAGGLRGVGIWNLNYGGGAPELWAALQNHFAVCSSVTASAAPASPQATSTAVTFTASASGCPNPRYQFWLLAPGSSTWTVAQAYSSSATFNWNTTGQAVGTYRYSVWARDAGSPAGYDTFFPGAAYTLNSRCVSVTASAAPASPQLPGTAVTLTASSPGCPNPLYEFWILAPGGSWTITQAYSTSATFTWNTAGKPVGAYLYSVWVRDATSSAAYDAYVPGIAYTLTSPCTSATASATPGAPQAVGTAVTITAGASGCSNPRYQFWLLAPGSSTWTNVQAYSSSATFVWNTAGNPAGTYRYSVWVRDAVSAAGYDAFFPGTVYILNSPCTSATGSAAPASPQAHGTTISFTASATGCPNPQYQFWMLAPGSSTWQLVQGYSTSATFSWNTAGVLAGSYLYSVWVRDAGSAAGYDAYFPGTAYRLT
jgi:spore germination protein YaaH